MNSLQIGFLIFILLPVIFSFIVDVVTFRSKKALWITWPEAILPLYFLEILIVLVIKIYLVLGKA